MRDPSPFQPHPENILAEPSALSNQKLPFLDPRRLHHRTSPTATKQTYSPQLIDKIRFSRIFKFF